MPSTRVVTREDRLPSNTFSPASRKNGNRKRASSRCSPQPTREKREMQDRQGQTLHALVGASGIKTRVRSRGRADSCGPDLWMPSPTPPRRWLNTDRLTTRRPKPASAATAKRDDDSTGRDWVPETAWRGTLAAGTSDDGFRQALVEPVGSGIPTWRMQGPR